MLCELTAAPTSSLPPLRPSFPPPQFFMQPSLTTGQGALQTDCGFSPFAYQLVGPGPIATLLLRYETPTTLLLRGVLRQDEPAHRASLQRFPGETSTLMANCG